MFHPGIRLNIGFESNWGYFTIESKDHREDLFTLKIETTGKTPLLLGHYCSISDAISAVTNQNTGYADWDQLSPDQLPSRVHDIVSWTFSQNFGTLSHAV